MIRILTIYELQLTVLSTRRWQTSALCKTDIFRLNLNGIYSRDITYKCLALSPTRRSLWLTNIVEWEMNQQCNPSGSCLHAVFRFFWEDKWKRTKNGKFSAFAESAGRAELNTVRTSLFFLWVGGKHARGLEFIMRMSPKSHKREQSSHLPIPL